MLISENYATVSFMNKDYIQRGIFNIIQTHIKLKKNKKGQQLGKTSIKSNGS